MIYLDNGATTFPKPPQVITAVNDAMRLYGANPGRSGHRLSLKAAEEIYNCRVKAAKLFGVKNEENVVFTNNCTHGLNIVIKGYLKDGDHVVTSNLEHNSVTRPLTEMAAKGITFTEATVYEDDDEKTMQSFRAAMNEKTRLVVCTHASNVFGIRLPVERITAMCHQYGIRVLIDGAQSAGILPVEFDKYNMDFFATAGHKGLYGPMGTGVLIVRDNNILSTLMEGGTGSTSISYSQPSIMPDKFESGTPNMPGIAGLSRGLDFINIKTINKISYHEMSLITYLYDSFQKNSKIKLYNIKRPNIKHCVPVLSFNVTGYDSEYVAAYLNKKYDIAVRAGLHCAPSAHNAMNTIDIGTVRVSPSYFNTKNQIYTLVRAIEQIR
ncbi:MAG TPA: aminotransferase class V-fold PLP-dependent enzyme [Clostridiales bacterium]|nr:aminotransferase class V-fold PLP-dependent enzyme [Clostridiales bacterium]